MGWAAWITEIFLPEPMVRVKGAPVRWSPISSSAARGAFPHLSGAPTREAKEVINIDQTGSELAVHISLVPCELPPIAPGLTGAGLSPRFGPPLAVRRGGSEDQCRLSAIGIEGQQPTTSRYASAYGRTVQPTGGLMGRLLLVSSRHRVVVTGRPGAVDARY